MLSRLSPRSRLIAFVGPAGALAVALLLFGGVAKAPADFRDDTTCRGHIAKGTPDPNDATTFGVNYRFTCSNPISGYMILTAPERQVQGTETEVFVTDKGGAVVPTDSFSCNGTFPGYGINCVAPSGQGYGANQRIVPGEFFVDSDLCTEPRLDPILYVAYSQVNAKMQAVQSLAGPFDLGRPRGCPKSKFNGKTKIPTSKDPVLSGQEG